MNKFAFGAAMAALSLALPGVAQAQRAPGAVIVVVDSDRVYRECTACKAAQTQLQALVASARTRATQIGQPLQTEAQSIEQAGAALRNQTGAARTPPRPRSTRACRPIAAPDDRQQGSPGSSRNIQSTQANVLRQINARLNRHQPVMTRRGANAPSIPMRPWPAPALSTSPTTSSPHSTRRCLRSA